MKTLKRLRFTLLELLIAMALTAILLTVISYAYRRVALLNIQADKEQQEAFENRYLENRLAEIIPRIPRGTPFFQGERIPGITLPGTENLLFVFDNCVKLDKDFAYKVLGRLFVDQNNQLVLAKWPAPSRWADETLPPMKLEILMSDVDGLAFQFFIPPVKGNPDKPLQSAEPETPQQTAPPGRSPGTPELPGGGRKLEDLLNPDLLGMNEIAEADIPEKRKIIAQAAPEQPQQPVRQQPRDPIDPSLRGQWTGEWPQEYQRLPAIIRIQVGKTDGTSKTYAFPLPHAKRAITYDQ